MEQKIDKEKIKYVVGIDLGHGETSAAYAEIGWDVDKGQLEQVRDIDLPQDKTFVIPSAIAIRPNGDVHIGADAFDYQDAELHVCFKKQPKSIDGKDEQLMIQFMRAVYVMIRERVGAILTDTNHLVYIATPSGWDKQSQDLYGQMAVVAGMPLGGVTWESRAAFLRAQTGADSGLPQYVDKGAIVFDMGSSTLDFTYISTDVLREHKKPIDYGYNCGASAVEKIMYQRLREANDVVHDFEQKYPKATDRLLFEMRKGKEEYFRKEEHKLRKTIDFYQLVNDEDMDIIRCSYDMGELESVLTNEGYVSAIRENMIDFAQNHINGLPIHAVFFTGGASRMNFLMDLVKEIWKVDFIFRDQNPSLTISQGVAEAARSDVRSGGSGNVKEEIDKIMAEIDVYTPFAQQLGERIEEEIKVSIATPLNEFLESNTNYSVAYLENMISKNIESDSQNISVWAKEYLEATFAEATQSMQEKMGKMMANYTSSDIRMGSLSSNQIKLPAIDTRAITSQIQSMTNSLTKEISTKMSVIIGGTLALIGTFLIGPFIGIVIGWLGGRSNKVVTWVSNRVGDARRRVTGKTKAQEQAEAKREPLNQDQRTEIYNEFAGKWDEICAKIHNTVKKTLNDSSTKNKINSQCKSILKDYAEECFRQTRIMLE